MKIMLTGHREISHPGAVTAALSDFLKTHSPEIAICGGAEGADTLWGIAAISTRTPFKLVLPNRFYRDKYRHPIQRLVDRAVEIEYAVDRDPGNWERLWHQERWWTDNFTRNHLMVDMADVCVIVSNKPYDNLIKDRKGGTAHCARYIDKSNKPTFYLDDSPTPMIRKVSHDRLYVSKFGTEPLPF